MTSLKQDESGFQKQLQIFEASMEDDLKKRSSDVAKKWEFDFTAEQPAKDATLENCSMQWEPVSATLQ